MKNSRARNRRSLALVALVAFTTINVNAQPASADWLTVPSTFTHSPATGMRVAQYQDVEAPPIVDQSRRISSGYTHFRSTIQFGQSADNYHRVEEWGPPVRPYGEWRFPFRPFSAPYPAWGAPFAGLGINNVGPNVFPGGGFPGGGFPGGGGPGWGNGNPGGNWGGGNQGGGNQGNWNPGGGFPGNGFPGNGNFGVQPNPYPPVPGGGSQQPPYYDGSYPEYAPMPQFNDRDFFFTPPQN